VASNHITQSLRGLQLGESNCLAQNWKAPTVIVQNFKV